MQHVLLIALLVLSACTGSSQRALYEPLDKTKKRSVFITEGKQGAISSAHPLASDAGLAMLKKGGNAIDAMVAASFAISVLKPQSSGIGGGGFLIFHDATSKVTESYDFRERAPKAAHKTMYLDAKGNPKAFTYKNKTIPDASANGHLSVGTPGLIAGLVDLHAKYGVLSLSDVMQPAIALAENGFPVYYELAVTANTRKEVLAAFEDSAKLFLPNGQPLKEGDTLVQKDLAWSLKEIARDGKKAFYEGEIARRLIAEIRAGHGILTLDDLKKYQMKAAPAVSGTYKGYKIYAMPPPSSGGVHIVQMLNILSHFNLQKDKHNSAAYAHTVGESMKLAFADRAKYLGDPAFVKVPTQALVSERYAAAQAKLIQSDKVVPANDPYKVDPKLYESPSTTHISVVDGRGNVASTTQTVNRLFGSGVVARGTGIVLNDEMDDFSVKPGVPNSFGLVGSEANAVAAYKTMLSSMSPTVLFDSKGEVRLVVGSRGGPHIITSVLQTILNTIDFNMPLEDAVHAYRFHNQWLPDKLRHEKGTFSQSDADALKKLGHQLEEVEFLGPVFAIAREGDGWKAVADTRESGEPRAY